MLPLLHLGTAFLCFDIGLGVGSLKARISLLIFLVEDTALSVKASATLILAWRGMNGKERKHFLGWRPQNMGVLPNVSGKWN